MDRVERRRRASIALAEAEAGAASTERRRRAWLVAFTLLYAVGLSVVLFWPWHIDGERGFVRTDVALDLLARLGVPASIRYPAVESAANAALFVPFGALCAAWLGWRPVRAVVTATALSGLTSLAAELVQARLLPERTLDLRDVVANVAGAALGAVVAALLARRLEPRPREGGTG